MIVSEITIAGYELEVEVPGDDMISLWNNAVKNFERLIAEVKYYGVIKANMNEDVFMNRLINALEREHYDIAVRFSDESSTVYLIHEDKVRDFDVLDMFYPD
jgi:hypothetical protein